MPFQLPTLEVLSPAEARAVERFVNDIQNRMQNVVGLLKDRGTPGSVHLAESIACDLKLLEKEVAAARKSLV